MDNLPPNRHRSVKATDADPSETQISPPSNNSWLRNVRPEIAACELQSSSSISIELRKNKDGVGWEMAFSAKSTSDSHQDKLTVDLSHFVSITDQRTVLGIQGIIRDESSRPRPQETQAENVNVDEDPDELIFHDKCGKNAILSEDKKTAERRNPSKEYGHCCVLTQRPLANNELFQVKVLEMNSSWTFSVGIGVTSIPPNKLALPEWMGRIQSRTGTWLMYNTDVFLNGETSISHYSQNLENLKVGDRIGVMRKESGLLHFYFNGIDLGPAAVNVPYGVYGFIDVTNNVVRVKIV